MNTDIFLAKGSSHFICEDYVLQGANYVIVSDGCSSAQHSDIAARLYAHAAKRLLKENEREITSKKEQDNFLWRLNYLVEVSKIALFGVPNMEMYATLLIAQDMEDKVTVSYFGDGVVVCKYKEESPTTFIIDYDNMPLYPAYYMNEQTLSEYLKVHGPEYSLNTLKNNTVAHRHYRIQDEQLPNLTNTLSFAKENLEYVIISSDGVGSFPPYQFSNLFPIIDEITSFKNRAGSFLQRRMIRMLTDYKKSGIDHYDDIGIGVLSYV